MFVSLSTNNKQNVLCEIALLEEDQIVFYFYRLDIGGNCCVKADISKYVEKLVKPESHKRKYPFIQKGAHLGS